MAKRLLGQVDKLVIEFDGFGAMPSWAAHPKIDARVFPDGSPLGSAGKLVAQDFASAEDVIVTVDDDLVIPARLVRFLLQGLSRLPKKAAVGLHGSELLEPFTSYVASRRVIHLSDRLEKDRSVDVIATCVMAFRAESFHSNFREFRFRNMTDLQVALEMQEQGIERFLLSRPLGWMNFRGEAQPDSIYRKLLNNDENQTALARKLLLLKRQSATAPRSW